MNLINFVMFVLIKSLLPFIGASETQHRTKAASEKQHDLWCYRCDSMADGEKCIDLAGNHTSMHIKCTKEQKKCQVQRISMSTSTDEVTGKPKMWLLRRDCSETCEPGCTVIGERTKLHSCITCCDEPNFCNAGSGGLASSPLLKLRQSFIIVTTTITILFNFYYINYS